ncbi:MAG: LysR family transcriptional regulator [Clostridia bacterium]|nr:LysR family transcriptional regulator [Clostridia bacterium]
MEIRQLQTFVTAARLESFSKAAKLLGYSQSAVTVQIRLLEEELGTRLFNRLGRRISLTAQGQRFFGAEPADSYMHLPGS